MSELLADGAAGARKHCLLQRFELTVAVERETADPLDEALKLLVARHKIGLGVDFNDRTDGTPYGYPDQTLRGDPPGFLCGRREALLAQPITGRFDITITFAKRPLTVHHPGAGFLAQFFDKTRSYLGHNMTPLLQNLSSALPIRQCTVAGSASPAGSPSIPADSGSPENSLGSSPEIAGWAISARAPISTPDAASSACSPSSTAPE